MTCNIELLNINGEKHTHMEVGPWGCVYLGGLDIWKYLHYMTWKHEDKIKHFLYKYCKGPEYISDEIEICN